MSWFQQIKEQTGAVFLYSTFCFCVSISGLHPASPTSLSCCRLFASYPARYWISLWLCFLCSSSKLFFQGHNKLEISKRMWGFSWTESLEPLQCLPRVVEVDYKRRPFGLQGVVFLTCLVLCTSFFITYCIQPYSVLQGCISMATCLLTPCCGLLKMLLSSWDCCCLLVLFCHLGRN